MHLSRVYLLTTRGTCSASEAIINGLRGIDVEVIQVGTSTCGKPYGFYPADNCGTTYFTIQFQSVNAKGFGDYPDGFSPSDLDRVEGVEVPGCAVGDDFSQPLGSTDEAMLATALAHRETGACPARDTELPPAALPWPGLPDDGQSIGRPGPGRVGASLVARGLDHRPALTASSWRRVARTAIACIMRHHVEQQPRR